MTLPAPDVEVEVDGRERLLDWAPPWFIDQILEQMAAPKSPITGEPLWEKGMRLHYPGQHSFVYDPFRWRQAAGGIRGGKTKGGSVNIVIDVLWRRYRGVNDDLWGCLGDTYSMVDEEMVTIAGLFDELGIMYDFSSPKNQRWTITFPDTAQEIRTMSGSDVSKIASKAYRGIVIGEAAQVDPEAIRNAEDRVSERRGWVAQEGTFEQTKGMHYNQQARQWQNPAARGKFYSLPTWENLVVYPGGRTDPEILSRESAMTRERFLERYGGEPSRRSKVVLKYADNRFQVQHRYPNSKTSYDPELPVYLFCDPGIAHAYAVAAVQFWPTGEDDTWKIDPRATKRQGEICWVIDAVYRWNRGVDQIVAECAMKPWAANVELAVMDVAARQRRAEGDPIVEQWPKLWRKHTEQGINVFTQQVPLHAGYDVHDLCLRNSWPEEDAQEMFNQDNKIRQVTDPYGPRLLFDPKAAPPLFGGKVDDREYEGEYNLHSFKVDPEGYATRPDPVDTHNDLIKALSYGLYWRYGPAGMRRPVKANADGSRTAKWSMEV